MTIIVDGLPSWLSMPKAYIRYDSHDIYYGMSEQQIKHFYPDKLYPAEWYQLFELSFRYNTENKN